MNLEHWFPSVIGREEHPEWVEPMIAAMDRQFQKGVNEYFYYNGQTT